MASALALGPTMEPSLKSRKSKEKKHIYPATTRVNPLNHLTFLYSISTTINLEISTHLNIPLELYKILCTCPNVRILRIRLVETGFRVARIPVRGNHLSLEVEDRHLLAALEELALDGFLIGIPVQLGIEHHPYQIGQRKWSQPICLTNLRRLQLSTPHLSHMFRELRGQLPNLRQLEVCMSYTWFAEYRNQTSSPKWLDFEFFLHSLPDLKELSLTNFCGDLRFNAAVSHGRTIWWFQLQDRGHPGRVSYYSLCILGNALPKVKNIGLCINGDTVRILDHHLTS